MGFFFRKAVRYGPVRFNFSKSGIGASIGVKGFRVTAPARGTTYVTVGSHGFYYRQPLSVRPGTRSGTPHPESQPSPASPNPPGAVPTADVHQLVECSGADVVTQLNQRSRAHNPAWWIYALATMLAFVSLGTANSFWLLVTVALIIVGGLLHHRSNDQRMTRLSYELSDSEVAKFNVTKQALIALRSAHMLWRVETQVYTSDRKRNAGASTLLNRSTVQVGKLEIPRVESNVGVIGIDLGRIRLYFLPDLILYWQAGTFAGIPYSDVKVTNGHTRFIEDGGVPSDGVVVDRTWRYVNKNGGPDRRFNNNRQLPVMQYGTLALTTGSGLNIHLQTSTIASATQFVEYFQQRMGGSRSQHNERRENRVPPTTPKGADNRAKAFAVLGIGTSATADDVSQAYHKMAQMYHPDKVAGLAPEFQALAEQRMREINAAYAILTRP